MTDIIVAGGGTAGLTAAIYARRAGKSVLLIEKESTGGQIVFAPRVENYPGLPGISGADYAAALTEQAEDLAVTTEYAEILSLSGEDGDFTVNCDSGEFKAKALILAPGASHRRLGIEGEEELTGCGLSYCAVCDGAFYEGKDVLVLGGGSTALTDALFLSGICRSVTLIHRRDTFRGEASLAARLREKTNVTLMLSSRLTGLKEEDGILTGVVVESLTGGQSRELKADGLFIAIGQIPQTEFCRGFVGLDESGYIIAGEDCISSRDGVYAAGDCRTKAVRQLTTAAADGAVAGLAACAYVDSLTEG